MSTAEVLVAAPAGSATERSPLRQLLAKPLPLVSVVFMAALVLLCLLAPLFIEPAEPDFSVAMASPSWDHPLGADDLGRDQVNRLIFATRTSLFGASIALVVAAVLGIPAGLLAGYKGGFVEASLSRVSDVIMSVPALLLALALVAVLGAGLAEAMAAVGLIFSPQFFRLSRATAKSVRQESYVEAMIALGFRHWRIMARHVLPNCVAVLAVQAAVVGSLAIQAEASLSFLGLGAQPPTPSLGVMLSEGFKRVLSGQHLVYPPGVVVGLIVLAMSFIGDGLRDVLQPPGRHKDR